MGLSRSPISVERAVDVVVLSWNRLEETLECLDSITTQKGVEIRAWLVDQGSSPSCLEALRHRCQQSGVCLLEPGHNLGVPGGRNLGMRAGQAPVIVCIDNDAVFTHDQVLATAWEILCQEDQLAALAFAISNGQGTGPDTANWGFPCPVEKFFHLSFPTARFCGAGHAIRREAFERTRGYDEKLFFFGEELDLAYQLVNQGYALRYEPTLGVNHRCSPEGRLAWSNGRFRYNVRNMLYLNYKYFRSPFQFLYYAAGYLVKGGFNGQLPTAVRGIVEGLALLPHCKEVEPLGAEAREYIQKHEFAPRGSFWRRFQHEVLIPMKESLTAPKS